MLSSVRLARGMLRIFNLLDYILHLKSFKLQIHSCFLGTGISNKLSWLTPDLKIRILNTWSQFFVGMQKTRGFWNKGINVIISEIKVESFGHFGIFERKKLTYPMLKFPFIFQKPLHWSSPIVKSHNNLLESLNMWLLITYYIGPNQPSN